MAKNSIVVDPAISRAKFERELKDFYQLYDDHIKRGWWIVKDRWPEVLVVFGIPRLSPPAVLCGALIDFTDYDFAPPSVRLVHPFTQVPYRARELPSLLLRTVLAPAPQQMIAMLGAQQAQFRQRQQLMVAFGEEEIPFLCVKGTLEYHRNPGHSGDSWFSYRGQGNEGTLYYLLNTIYQYGSAPIDDYQLKLTVSGFSQTDVPQ